MSLSMYWLEIVDAVRNGARVRRNRNKWKYPDRYIWYDQDERRMYEHFKHHDRPWYLKKVN